MSKALKLIHLCRRDTNESTLLEDSNESILLSTSNRVIGQYTFLLKFCTFKFCLHMSTWLSASSNKVTIPKANTQNNNSHHFRCNTPLYLYIPCLLPLLSSLSSKSSLPKPPTIHTTLPYLTLTLSKAEWDSLRLIITHNAHTHSSPRSFALSHTVLSTTPLRLSVSPSATTVHTTQHTTFANSHSFA